ncbi:MAG: hypothetical protein KC917_21965, partial [Candidatus Omnitrophica bacterium]|nr:hypothetical protein [Candidatus Omnitrophota bacterium]
GCAPDTDHHAETLFFRVEKGKEDKTMLSKIATIPAILSLLFAGSIFLAQPASADDDGWGFSLGGNGLGFYYNDYDNGHHGHHYRGGHRYRHHHHPGHYGNSYYYRPYYSRGYRYYQPYYPQRWYYPGGLSFHFD